MPLDTFERGGRVPDTLWTSSLRARRMQPKTTPLGRNAAAMQPIAIITVNTCYAGHARP